MRVCVDAGGGCGGGGGGGEGMGGGGWVFSCKGLPNMDSLTGAHSLFGPPPPKILASDDTAWV